MHVAHLRSCHRRRRTARTRPGGWCRRRWPAAQRGRDGDSLWLRLKAEQSADISRWSSPDLWTLSELLRQQVTAQEFRCKGDEQVCRMGIVFVSSPDGCCASSLLAAVSPSLRMCGFSLLFETCWTRMKDEACSGAFRGVVERVELSWGCHSPFSVAFAGGGSACPACLVAARSSPPAG